MYICAYIWIYTCEIQRTLTGTMYMRNFQNAAKSYRVILWFWVSKWWASCSFSSISRPFSSISRSFSSISRSPLTLLFFCPNIVRNPTWSSLYFPVLSVPPSRLVSAFRRKKSGGKKRGISPKKKPHCINVPKCKNVVLLQRWWNTRQQCCSGGIGRGRRRGRRRGPGSCFAAERLVFALPRSTRKRLTTFQHTHMLIYGIWRMLHILHIHWLIHGMHLFLPRHSYIAHTLIHILHIHWFIYCIYIDWYMEHTSSCPDTREPAA